jgi:L-asparaginase
MGGSTASVALELAQTLTALISSVTLVVYLSEGSGNMKKILLLSTGGTISCVNTAQGLVPSLTFDQMLNLVNIPKEQYQVDGVQLMNIDSGNIQIKHWSIIANQIKENYHEYDGFVITHGTDTLAYTSAALSYLIQDADKPIVITGSQLPIGSTNTDGISNLRNSILFAGKQLPGVFVVFDNKVIIGNRTKKVKTTSYDAFTSLNSPDVADIAHGRFRWNRWIYQTLDQKTQPKFYTNLSEQVTVLKLVPGLNTKVLEFMASMYKAIVIEAYGTGTLPVTESSDYYQTIKKISATGCLVVISSQSLTEGTHMDIYELSKKFISIPNVIEAGLLSVECALTKMMWALGNSDTTAQAIDMFKSQVYYDNVDLY